MNESGPKDIEKKEKPPFLYHGTTSFGVEGFEPRKKSVPGALNYDEIPAAIYAGDDPAYAAAHSFVWGSNEGFDLGYENGKVVFIVPEELKDRLNVKVCIYKLASNQFEPLDIEPMGHNFWTQEKVKPASIEEFGSVTEAVEHYGGEVRYKK